jgi:sodium-dependent dicarboxylate transporter 2/3/5
VKAPDAPPRAGASLLRRILAPPPLTELHTEFRWPDDRPRDYAPPAAPGGPAAAARTGELASSLGAFAGILGALWLWLSPPFPGLAAPGQAALAVFVLAAAFWITDFLPVGVTGLLAVALLGLTGALPPAAAFAAFGNSAVFFILGVFILAAALIQTGISRRLALALLARFEAGPYRLAAGMMLTAALLTAVMPAQATAAMLFPIALEIVQAMRLRREASAYAKVLFLALAWGAMVGSNFSFLGSTRAPLALGLLGEHFGQRISYGQWALAAAPAVVIGLAVGFLILRVVFPREPVDMAAARRSIDASVAELGPMRARHAHVITVVLGTVAAWIGLGDRVDLAAIALVGVALLFAAGALRWAELDGYVHWGIVLMYGGAIALGVAVERTGAGAFLASRVFDGAALGPYAVLAAVIILTVLLTEVMSNAAAVAVMLPLAFGLVDRTGVPPVAIVLACSMAAGLDFTFPFSSAPSSIVYGGGYLRMRDLLRAGTLMTVAQIALLLAVARFWWPVVGVR